MALLFMDSFDHYAKAEITKKYFAWTNDGGIDATLGRRGGGCAYVHPAYNGTSYWTLAVPSNNASVIAGFAWYSAGYRGTWVFRGTGNLAQVNVNINANGGLSAYRCSAGGALNAALLGSTRTGVVTLTAWYYIEIKVVIHGSAGRVVIHVNGLNEPTTPDCSSGQNTMPSGSAVVNQFYFYGHDRIDDLYVLDTSGSLNNDFLGDARVDAHYPVTPDGTNHAWTPSTGSDNFAMVDEVTPNITDYNSTNTTDAVDTFHMEAFKNSGASIKGLQLSLYHSKEDAGACLVAPVTLTHETEYVGDNVAPSESSYLYNRTLQDVNPFSGVAWSESEFNVVEVGYEKTG